MLSDSRNNPRVKFVDITLCDKLQEFQRLLKDIIIFL